MYHCYTGRKVFKGEHQGSVFDLATEKRASQICKVCKTQDSKISKDSTDKQILTK